MGYDLISRVSLRAMAAEDIPAGLGLCRAAGWNQLAEDWQVFLNTPGGGGFVAEKEDRFVGTVAFLRYDAFAWIAMMLVDPQERGAGIGAHLMKEALSALSDAGCIGLDATPLGEALYRRYGFVDDFSLVRTRAVIEASRFQGPLGRARRMNIVDMHDVLTRDREVFGADRGQLLASLLRRAPECAWIVKEGTTVLGYTFGRPGQLYHQLGPIVADGRSTAQSLVTHCFSELIGKPFVIDVPRYNEGWLGWLGSVGFVEERPLLRMFRCAHRRHPSRVPRGQYAITGPEFA